MYLATQSLPTPLSPVMSTFAELSPARSASDISSVIARLATTSCCDSNSGCINVFCVSQTNFGSTCNRLYSAIYDSASWPASFDDEAPATATGTAGGPVHV